MDAKELKNCLKNAREAIGRKDFKEALRQCKLVLSQEKNNYNALVFVGVAAEGLEQTDQALKAYKRATEAAPEKVLAWQGLCGFYEKHPNNPEYASDLVSVYERLLEFYSGDKDKQLDVHQKLADLHMTVGAIDKATELYQTLITSSETGEKRVTCQCGLARLLQGQSKLSHEHEDLLCETYASIFSSSVCEAEDVQEMISNYINILMQRGSALTEVCNKLGELFPTHPYLLEIQLVMDMEMLIGQENPEISPEMEKKQATLSELFSESTVLKAVQGVMKFLQRDWLTARTYLSQAVDQNPRPVCTFYFLAMTQYRLHRYTEAERQYRQGVKALGRKDRILNMKSSVMKDSLRIQQAWCLYRLGSAQTLETSLQLITEISCPESVLLQGFIHLQLGNIQKAEDQLAAISGDSAIHSGLMALCGSIAVCKQNFSEAIDKFQMAIEEKASYGEYHLMIAKTYWQIRMHSDVDKPLEKCFASLLKAAKLDPYNTETFMYLGHFYKEIQQDLSKSKKCYQKSFDLDTTNIEAGSALCDILSALGEEEEAHTVLVSVTDKASAGSAKWAWLRLGLYQVKHDGPSVAVTSFQAALRADPHDNHVWECLAEAYLYRGSFTAALKAFTKASELDPDSMYCLFQIASIKQTIGLYTEALSEYKLILEKSPNYVPALKGLGETSLLMARLHLKQYFDGRARDNCQDVIVYLTRAASHRPDLSCLWKLLGDACSLLHPLADEDYRLTVPEKLAKKSIKEISETDSCVLSKMETLELGARCYGRALKLLPDCSALWHDLGVNYYYQLQHSSVENKASLAERALQALKKSISLNPTNHKHWTALGVVCCSKDVKKLDLGQHCFIKSIEVENNNVVAWTNLAVLYLENNNIELAHEAFKVAQSLEPSYVACWIGQALIAEAIGDEDSMDLFRHTTELGHHTEGAIGYASWVCAMLKDTSKHQTDMYKFAIQQMAAIPAASDALAKYLDRMKTNHTAYNLYGLLLEQQGLYTMAAKAFRCAINLLEENPKFGEDYFHVVSNYTRTQCAAGQYREALAQFYKMDAITRFDDMCNFGLALYKVENFEESFKVYGRAERIASTEVEKSHVHAALGMVAYKFGDVEGAKTSFFQSSQSSAPSVWGLEALCALGIIKSDQTLAIAVIQELFKHENTDGHQADIGSLAAFMEVLKDDLSSAKSHIQKLIHKDPTQAVLWEVLAKVLTRFSSDSGMAAAACARCALELGLGNKTVMTLITSGELSAGQHFPRDKKSSGLLSAQRAMHTYPDQLENLCNLAAAVYCQGVLADNENGMTFYNIAVSYTKHISLCEITLAMKLWSFKYCVLSLIQCGKLDEAAGTIKQMRELSSESSDDIEQFVDVMNSVLTRNTSGIAVKVTQGANSLYYWQILIEQYLRNGLQMEVEAALKACLQFGHSDSTRQLKFMSLLQLAYFAFMQLQKAEGDLVQMKALFEEAAEEVKKIDSQCSALKLMQGILLLEEKPKLSKRYACQVVDMQNVVTTHGYDRSLARCILIKLLYGSAKDQETLEAILREAEETGDKYVSNYYQKLRDG